MRLIINALLIFALLPASGLCLTPLPTVQSRTSLFRTYDRNGDGKITLQEFLEVNDSRNAASRDYLTKVFRKMDLNGDGVITLEEYLAPLRAKDK